MEVAPAFCCYTQPCSMHVRMAAPAPAATVLPHSSSADVAHAAAAVANSNSMRTGRAKEAALRADDGIDTASGCAGDGAAASCCSAPERGSTVAPLHAPECATLSPAQRAVQSLLCVTPLTPHTGSMMRGHAQTGELPLIWASGHGPALATAAPAQPAAQVLE